MNPTSDPPALAGPAPSPTAPVGDDLGRAAGSVRPTPLRITAGLAIVGVLLAAFGLYRATRTVETPVQDCGVAAAFILDGRVNEFADPDEPPAGLTAAQVRDNNDDPCQERAADQAGPGALLIVTGTAVGLGAVVVEALFRWRWRRRRQRPVQEAGSPPTSRRSDGDPPDLEGSRR